jgi:hypothetical protein
MTRWLNVWRMNPQAMPPDPAQAARVWAALAGGVMSWLDSGDVQEWGMYPDGSGGYAIFDDAGKADALMLTLRRTSGMLPFVICDVRPILDAGEARAALQRA